MVHLLRILKTIYRGIIQPIIIYILPQRLPIFQKEKKTDNAASFLLDEQSADDNIFTDLETHEFSRSTQVLGESYRIKDFNPIVKWKITDEVREIAGFECNRAETILYDSIYVIAFFSNRIESTGGPLGFSGLPGMILGIVVPRLNLTLFATKLELANTDPIKKVQFPPEPDILNSKQFKQKMDQLRLKRVDNLRNGLIRVLL